MQFRHASWFESEYNYQRWNKNHETVKNPGQCTTDQKRKVITYTHTYVRTKLHVDPGAPGKNQTRRLEILKIRKIRNYTKKIET